MSEFAKTFDGTPQEIFNLQLELDALSAAGFHLAYANWCATDFVNIHHADTGLVVGFDMRDVNSADEMQRMLSVFMAGVAHGKGE